MAHLQSDQHGFLVGDPVDLGRMPKYLLDIKGDVAAIKRAVVRPSDRTKQPLASAPVLGEGKPKAIVAVPVAAKKAAYSAKAANDASGASKDRAENLIERLRVAPTKAAVMPSKRDASGKFTSNGGDAGLRDSSPGAVTALANRLSALAGIGSGMEEADPTIKAFKEVAEPMKRGFEFFGGSKDDKQTKWLRNIFGVLNVFRKEETVYQKATQKTLKAIEGKPVGGGGDDNSGIMTILAARLGPALLAGITAVLGFIFSPIGLAIVRLRRLPGDYLPKAGKNSLAKSAQRLSLDGMGWFPPSLP